MKQGEGNNKIFDGKTDLALQWFWGDHDNTISKAHYGKVFSEDRYCLVVRGDCNSNGHYRYEAKIHDGGKIEFADWYYTRMFAQSDLEEQLRLEDLLYRPPNKVLTNE